MLHGTSANSFVYDGWNMIEELDGVGSVAASYVWGLDLSQSLQGAGGVGGLLVRVEDGASHVYSYDGNGNVGQMLDSTGAIAAHYEYDPFGKNINAYGPQSAINPYRFSTKYFDNETDLYYYGYRYYMPELGRWLNRDPIGEQGGVNLYGFVGNDGVGGVDRLGLDVFVLYRRLDIDGLRASFPLTGHVYLGFNNDHMQNSQEWRQILQEHRELVEDGWITFSFHPDGVRTNSNRGNRVSVMYTETSWVAISDFDADILPILDNDTIEILATENPCEQIRVFREALSSATINRLSPSENDRGHYSFLIRNCGSWAQATLEAAGVNWPPGAYFLNLGAGLDGILDYTLIPQTAYGMSVIGYHVVTGTGQLLLGINNSLEYGINTFNETYVNIDIGPTSFGSGYDFNDQAEYPGITFSF